MAYIYVDGEEFPYPERGVGIIITTPVNSARNTKAEVVGQRIGRDQYKINNLKWPMLSANQWSFILKKFRRGFGVPVTFPDPVTGEWITLKMYRETVGGAVLAGWGRQAHQIPELQSQYHRLRGVTDAACEQSL